MKTELIFVDSSTETARGFYRGTIALVLFLLVIVLWHWVFKSIYPTYMYSWKLWTSLLVFGILFASAIAVAHPKSMKVAAVYGGLVGLVVFGCINMALFAANIPIRVVVLDVVFGILLGILLAVTLFKLAP